MYNFVLLSSFLNRHSVWYQNVSKRITYIVLREQKVYFYLNHGVELDAFVFI